MKRRIITPHFKQSVAKAATEAERAAKVASEEADRHQQELIKLITKADKLATQVEGRIETRIIDSAPVGRVVNLDPDNTRPTYAIQSVNADMYASIARMMEAERRIDRSLSRAQVSLRRIPRSDDNPIQLVLTSRDALPSEDNADDSDEGVFNIAVKQAFNPPPQPPIVSKTGFVLLVLAFWIIAAIVFRANT